MLIRRAHVPTRRTPTGYRVYTAPTRALAYRWRADSGLVLTGNTINSWTSSVGQQTFAPVTPGSSEFFYVAQHPGFKGRPVIQNNLTSASSRMICSNGTQWRFLHDGTGMTVVVIGALSATIHLNTNGGGATAVGANLRPGGSGFIRLRIGNGTSTVFDMGIDGVPRRSDPSLWIATHKSTRSPQAEMWRGHSSLITASEAATPATGNAAQGLEYYGLVQTEISVAEILLYNDALSGAERDVLCRYAETRYGVLIS